MPRLLRQRQQRWQSRLEQLLRRLRALWHLRRRQETAEAAAAAPDAAMAAAAALSGMRQVREWRWLLAGLAALCLLGGGCGHAYGEAHAHGEAHADDAHAHGEGGLPAHNCAHDALHAVHRGERAMAPQAYGAARSLEKRAGELMPSEKVDQMRIAVYDGFLEQDPGMTCYTEGAWFSIGGAGEGAPECSELNTGYCRGRCTAQFVLSAEKRAFLQHMLIPELTRITRSLLSVQPVSEGLVLNGGSCGFYGGVQIPAELTRVPGMREADFVLFLTARPIYGDTIAYAGHCQTDQNGRPVAAHFNWSPSHFQSRMDARMFAYYTRVALHELTHALVFSPSLVADFPRGEDGRLHSLEMLPSWHGRQRAVVSPRVAAAARAQFGCESLRGALLEDGGGSGSAGSHWESRLFRDEYMTAAASPGPRVLSALTLALFADSGWYVVNGSQAEPMLWGFRAGCDFVGQSCASWGQLKESVDGLALPAFTCGQRSADACHYDQRSKAYCELKRYERLPADERYFPDDFSLAGYSQMLDYCPVYRAYSNGDCTDRSNSPGSFGPRIAFVDELSGDEIVSAFGPQAVDPSQYCPSCRCFETDAPTLMSTSTHPGALAPGCFRFRCVDERTLQVHLGENRWASCPEPGGVARLLSTEARGKPLHLKCPPAARLCALGAESWPRVETFSPARGPVGGGTNVTVRGANFGEGGSAPAVYVCDAPARLVRVHSPTLLTFVTGVEPGATSRELCDVSVEDAHGRSAVSYRAFTYLPGWQPYCEMLALLAVLLVAALWLVPRQVTALLAEHARLVRVKRVAAKAKAADAAASSSGAAAPPADNGSGAAARAAGAASASVPPADVGAGGAGAAQAWGSRGPAGASADGASPGQDVRRNGRPAKRSADGPYTAEQLL
ncbi:hypothetical protein T492DRAFT_912026 [Pavlovales sp. CCMP2436]|nr:hypothetical protein T492DRAFT_912026 [Pavlovales sp. CCMP2436]